MDDIIYVFWAHKYSTIVGYQTTFREMSRSNDNIEIYLSCYAELADKYNILKADKYDKKTIYICVQQNQQIKKELCDLIDESKETIEKYIASQIILCNKNELYRILSNINCHNIIISKNFSKIEPINILKSTCNITELLSMENEFYTKSISHISLTTLLKNTTLDSKDIKYTTEKYYDSIFLDIDQECFCSILDILSYDNVFDVYEISISFDVFRDNYISVLTMFIQTNNVLFNNMSVGDFREIMIKPGYNPIRRLFLLSKIMNMELSYVPGNISLELPCYTH